MSENALQIDNTNNQLPEFSDYTKEGIGVESVLPDGWKITNNDWLNELTPEQRLEYELKLSDERLQLGLKLSDERIRIAEIQSNIDIKKHEQEYATIKENNNTAIKEIGTNIGVGLTGITQVILNVMNRNKK